MLNVKRSLVRFTFATAVIFSSISLFGDNYKLEVSKTLDSNAEQSYYPDLVIPLTWNNYLSSSFEYRSGELTDERSSVSGGDTVSVNESIKHKRFKLNLLNYKVDSAKASYFFGIGGAWESFDKSQYGTYTSTLGDNYTNDITIDVLSLYLKAQTIQKLSFVDLKAYLLAMPYSNLDVSQKTSFEGSIVDNSSNSSSETQDFTYEAEVDLISKTGTFVDFGFLINYRVLPLKYSLSILGTEELIDTEEKTLRLKASLLFNVEILNGWMPTLAYSTETRESDGESNTEKKIYLGFNTRF